LQLEAAGVATPRHWAAAVRRRWFRPMAGYLVVEEVPGAVTLRAHVRARGGLARETVDRLADLLAHLHDANFSHRDLKGTNLLLDATLRPWLIDLDSLRRYRRLPAYWARSNLIRFAREFTAYPLLLKWGGRRFLRRYCQQRGLVEQFRELDQQIGRALQARP
jgi:serine/threonine protein kinase